MKKRFNWPSPAMTVACLALFVALSGSAVAATAAKNSVTNKSIKANAVTSNKIKNSTITGGDVKNDALTGSDVNESTLGTVPSAATANSVAPGGVNAAAIPDHSLSVDKVARYSGTFAFDPDSIAANSCENDGWKVYTTEPELDFRDDAIVVTMEHDFTQGLVWSTMTSDSPGFIRLRMCNITGAPIDAAANEFHWVAFDTP